MKNNSLMKDTLREIWTTRSRFFSIFAIIALGCGFFAGLKSTCPDMLLTAQNYYIEYNLSDINVKSTMGITESDLEALRAMRNIYKVQPGYYADVFIKDKNLAAKICHVISIKLSEIMDDNYINKLNIVEGRLPDRTNECVVDVSLIRSSGYQIGDKIFFYTDEKSEISDMFSITEFVIVGAVESVSYVSYERGSTSIGDGVINYYIYVAEEAFSYEVYTEVFVTFKDTRLFSFDSVNYSELIDNKTELIKEIAGIREQGRYDEIMKQANDEIAKAEDKLAQADEEYKKGLSEYNEKIASAEAEIAEGEEKLEALNGLYDIVIELSETMGEEFVENFEAILKILQAAGYFPDNSTEDIKALAGNLEELLKYLNTQKNAANKQLNDGKAQLASAKRTGWASLKDAKAQIDSGYAEIKKSKEELSKIDKPSWYIFDRDNNPGYSTYAEDAERVDKIATVFPVFFILVAALVCTTTMTRMVEEQRTAIGTLKALGYSRGTILMKYLIYSLLASIMGSIFGLCLGFKVFPTIIFAAYNIMYTFPPIVAKFWPLMSLCCIVASMLCTGLASFFVCYKELFDVPASLMRPKTPKAGKRILLEKITFIWDHIGFLKKVTIRNILRYKKRMMMTVIGIAGCTALLFAGFGIRYAISEIVSLQYETIFNYDLMGIFNSDASDEELTDLRSLTENTPYTKELTYITMQSVSVNTQDGIKRDVYLVVPEEKEALYDFIDMHERVSKEDVRLADSGVVVCEKLSKLYNLSEGDELRISLSDTKSAYFTVTGICENYTLNYVYLSRQSFLEGFGEEAVSNGFFLNMNDTQKENELSNILLTDENILALSYSSVGGGKFKDIVGSLNYIVILIIVCAGALAFVVLYNLANINVNERLREIATIKVLGFYDKEVSTYINRENTVASVIGITLGLFFGIPFERFIISTAEVDAVMFVPTVDIYCYIYAVALAAGFTAIVNFAMHKRLKKVDMIESLKSIE